MRIIERPEGLVDGDLQIVRVDLPRQRNTLVISNFGM